MCIFELWLTHDGYMQQCLSCSLPSFFHWERGHWQSCWQECAVCLSLAATMVRCAPCSRPTASTQHLSLYFTSSRHCDAQHGPHTQRVFYSSISTAGWHCTSTHCLYLYHSIVPNFLACLQKLYTALQPGDPLDACMLLGPLCLRQQTFTAKLMLSALLAFPLNMRILLRDLFESLKDACHARAAHWMGKGL